MNPMWNSVWAWCDRTFLYSFLALIKITMIKKKIYLDAMLYIIYGNNNVVISLFIVNIFIQNKWNFRSSQWGSLLRAEWNVWRWLCRHAHRKISSYVNEGLSGGFCMGRPGARTPIGVSGNFINVWKYPVNHNGPFGGQNMVQLSLVKTPLTVYTTFCLQCHVNSLQNYSPPDTMKQLLYNQVYIVQVDKLYLTCSVIV